MRHYLKINQLMLIGALFFINFAIAPQSTMHNFNNLQATYSITAQKPTSLWKQCIPYISLATVPIASWMCAPVGLCILAGVAVSASINRNKKKVQTITPAEVTSNHETVFESPKDPFSGYVPASPHTHSFDYQQLHCTHDVATKKESSTEAAHPTYDTDLLPANSAVARQQICATYEHNAVKITKQTYSLCPSSADILERYELPSVEYQQCVGSPAQHIIHCECIAIIERTAQFQPLRNTTIEEHIIEFVDIGRACNQNGYMGIALKSLDVCWGFLRCSYAIVDGMADGVIELAESVIYIGQHPVRTTKELLQSVVQTGACLAALADKTANLLKTKGGQFLGLCHNTDRADAFIEQCTLAATQLALAIKNNPYDAIKQTSKNVTETYLTGKIFGCIQKVISSAATQAPHYFETIKSLVDNALKLHQSGTATVSIPHATVNKDAINSIPLTIIYNAMNHEAEYGTTKLNDKKYDSKKEAQNNPVPNKHPHGKYEDAPYHHQNSSGKKNPAPKDGQLALDHSVEVNNNHPKKKRRVGLSKGEIVVLDQTSPGLYHGHIESWNELHHSCKKALKQAGFSNEKGKIFWPKWAL